MSDQNARRLVGNRMADVLGLTNSEVFDALALLHESIAHTIDVLLDNGFDSDQITTVLGGQTALSTRAVLMDH